MHFAHRKFRCAGLARCVVMNIKPEDKKSELGGKNVELYSLLQPHWTNKQLQTTPNNNHCCSDSVNSNSHRNYIVCQNGTVASNDICQIDLIWIELPIVFPFLFSQVFVTTAWLFVRSQAYIPRLKLFWPFCYISAVIIRKYVFRFFFFHGRQDYSERQDRRWYSQSLV